MFNFHLDTFPVCDGWTTDPFIPRLDNGRLYGLGARDMKGRGACILAAVDALLASGAETVIRKTGVASIHQLTWDERPTPAPAPYLVRPDQLYVQTVRRLLEQETDQAVELVLSRSVADTNHFAIYGGIPTLVCGPQGGNTCRADEYVEISSLPVIARTYIQVAIELLGIGHPQEPTRDLTPMRFRKGLPRRN